MSRLSVISFLIFLLSGALLYTCQSPDIDRDHRPNVVLLLADDLGHHEIGCYGQDLIHTPNLDSLAASGLSFSNFYAGNTVCAPSRAVLLTGRSAGHVPIRGNAGYFGNDKWEGVALPRDEFTLGEMFRDAGYQSAFIGKWHLDNPDDPSTWAYAHGFHYAAQEQWTGRFGKRKFPNGGLWVNGDQVHFPYDYKQHACKDAFYTNFAIEFLQRKEDDRPFFLFMSYRAPHSFEGPIRDTLFYTHEKWPKVEQAHAAKITLLDQEVGRLRQYLRNSGDLDHTLIIFTSDNGAHFSTNARGHQLEFFNSNGDLRGGKRDLYEGGLRVPLLISWPGVIRPESWSNHMAGFQDIMPTLAEVIKADLPSRRDGISFLPLLLRQEQKQHDFLHWEFQLSGWFQTIPDGGFRQSVRMNQWKAVRYGIASTIELYDLGKDIGETQDLSAQHPEIIKKMNKIFETDRTETDGFPYGGIVQNHKSQDRYRSE